MKINSVIDRTFMDTPTDGTSPPTARSIGSLAVGLTVLGMVSSSKQVRHQTHQKQNYENEKEDSGNLRSSESDNPETKDARY